MSTSNDDLKDIEETIRCNGEVVVGALKSINGPATITNVVQFLAAVHELDPTKIKEPVKEILTTGYNLGFLNKKGAKYTLDSRGNAFQDDLSKI